MKAQLERDGTVLGEQLSTTRSQAHDMSGSGREPSHRHGEMQVSDMKRMRARRPGSCTECQFQIQAGDEILWSMAKGAKHVVCPKPAQKVEGEYAIKRRSAGRHDAGYALGYCFEHTRKDGSKSFVVIIGVGKYQDMNTEEWMCSARVRPATEEEAAPVRARLERTARDDADKKRFKEIHHQVRQASIEKLPNVDGRVLCLEDGGEYLKIIVLNDQLYAHQTSRDDFREYVGHMTDAALATEARAIGDRLWPAKEQ